MRDKFTVDHKTLAEIQDYVRDKVYPAIIAQEHELCERITSNLDLPNELTQGKSLLESHDAINDYVRHAMSQIRETIKFEIAAITLPLAPNLYIGCLEPMSGTELAHIFNEHVKDGIGDTQDQLNDLNDDDDDTPPEQGAVTDDDIPFMTDPPQMRTMNEQTAAESTAVINELSRANHEQETKESTPEPHVDPTGTQAKVLPNTMSIATIRSIIIERVDDEQIQSIIQMHKAKMSVDEIRDAGIALANEVIETIISDYASRTQRKEQEPTPDHSDVVDSLTQAHDDASKRQAIKMYKAGYTIEYIAANLRLNIDDVNSSVIDINDDECQLNPITQQLIEAQRANGLDAFDIANDTSLRLNMVDQHLIRTSL